MLKKTCQLHTVEKALGVGLRGQEKALSVTGFWRRHDLGFGQLEEKLAFPPGTRGVHSHRVTRGQLATGTVPLAMRNQWDLLKL